MGRKKKISVTDKRLTALKKQIYVKRHGRMGLEKVLEEESHEQKRNQIHVNYDIKDKPHEVDSFQGTEAIEVESNIIVSHNENVNIHETRKFDNGKVACEEIDETYRPNDQFTDRDKTPKRKKSKKAHKINDEHNGCDASEDKEKVNRVSADAENENVGTKQRKRKRKHMDGTADSDLIEFTEIEKEDYGEFHTDFVREHIDSDMKEKYHKKKKKKKKKKVAEQIEQTSIKNKKRKRYSGPKMNWFDKLTEIGKPLFEEEEIDENFDKIAEENGSEAMTYEFENRNEPQATRTGEPTPENNYFDQILSDFEDKTNGQGNEQLDVHTSDKADFCGQEERQFSVSFTEMENRKQSPTEFTFTLSEEEWNQVKPENRLYGTKLIQRRKLVGNWTNIFSDHIKQVHPGCILAFKGHRVKSKNSRKVTGPFLAARAVCKGHFCKGVFDLKIIDETGPKNVLCTVEGVTKHTESEVNRRNLSGQKRMSTGERLLKSTPAVVFNENLLTARTEEMEQGNFSTVPNQSVLRKIVSELVRKESLHSNILHELQLLKENDELIGSPYIRELGLDPFVIMMFSEEQLKLAQSLSATHSLDIYMDATGSVIKNIERQKRPFLYSLVVKLPEAEVPVSIGDMVSTQHTIPRISHFLLTMKRHISLKGHILNIRKIESDFSFAIIQACLQVFNSMNLKTYLQKCYQILETKQHLNLTVHHICASHMIKDISCLLKKKLSKDMHKETRTFVMQSFAALQNSDSLKQGVEIFQQICAVCMSKGQTKEVKTATQRLQNLVNNQDDEVGNEFDGTEETLEFEEELDLNVMTDTKKTIREVSPFTKIFENVKVQTYTDISDTDTIKNSLYLPELPDLLISSYLPLFPLWSGAMLALMKNDTEIMLRDTNSPVENWFKYLKTNVTRSNRDRRPAVFVMMNKAATHARLRLEAFPGARKKKTKRKKLDETDLISKEEVWRKKKSRKGNLYHKSPSKKIKKGNKPKVDGTSLPRVMKWGGSVDGMKLTNTCTIDNGLTILHLFYQAHDEFRDFLYAEKETKLFNTLKTVLKLMDESDYDQAKLVWARLTASHSTDLFGDEVEFMMGHLETSWETRTVSRCLGSECPEPVKEGKKSSGFHLRFSDNIDSLQELVDKWLYEEVECTSRTNNTETEGYQIDTDVCKCIRQKTRIIVRSSPVFVVRVYEFCLYDRLSFDSLLQSQQLDLNGHLYKLAGITMYKEGHFCAIIMLDGCMYWYDGLVGRLRKPPHGYRDLFFPSHALFCQIG